MKFKDVVMYGKFKVDDQEYTKIDDNGAVVNGDKYVTFKPVTTVQCPDLLTVETEVADSIRNLYAALKRYRSLTVDDQKHVRHVVYQTVGNLGKPLFKSDLYSQYETLMEKGI